MEITEEPGKLVWQMKVAKCSHCRKQWLAVFHYMIGCICPECGTKQFEFKDRWSGAYRSKAHLHKVQDREEQD